MKITVEAENWEEHRIAEFIANKVQAHVDEHMDGAIHNAAQRAVDKAVERFGEEVIRAAVVEAIAEGWQKTNTYGEPIRGEKVSLKERIAKLIEEPVGDYNRRQSRIEKLVGETVEATLRDEMKKELSEVRTAFRQKAIRLRIEPSQRWDYAATKLCARLGIDPADAAARLAAFPELEELGFPDTWVCEGCGRERPPCDGGDDDGAQLCDRCWAAKHKDECEDGDYDPNEDHGCPRCRPAAGEVLATTNRRPE